MSANMCLWPLSWETGTTLNWEAGFKYIKELAEASAKKEGLDDYHVAMISDCFNFFVSVRKVLR